jgi:serine/threonine-protein kinase
MKTPDELTAILDRLIERKHTEADIITLRQVLNDIMTSGVTSEQRQIVIQLGKYNVNIGEGKELRIGDRTFQEVNDETMKALTRALPPLNQFKSLIEDKTKWFVGRTYVFDAIQSFINNNPKGYFTVIGDPGQGKSAILAKYVQNTRCVAHFNVQLQGINRADQFLESVCRQLVIRYDLPYDPLPPRTTQDGEFLNQLLEEVAQKADGQPVVIAVDALDEVDSSSYRDANILYLPPQLPDGIYFILTRRRVDLPLTLYVPTQSLSLLDEQYQADSERDVRTYIQNRIDDSNTLRQRIDERQESISDFINKLTEKSEKNFMYLRYILQDIESGLYKDLELERFPHGLQGYYEFHWRRMGMMNQPLPTEKIKIVYILAEVRQPVSVRKICDFSSEDGSKVEEVIKEWKQFLHDLRKNEQIRYSVYHSSFRDFLHRQDILASHPITLQNVHRRIAEDQLSFWERFKEMRRGNRRE